MKAGVVIDVWKLPIFERHLQAAGYTFEKEVGLADDVMLLTVRTDNVEALRNVLKDANTEAAMTGYRVYD